MGKRREQFNFRTSLLSDEAYDLIRKLSESRQLSQQIAAWAQEEINRNKQTPQIDTSTEILKELKTIKSMIQSKSFYLHDSHNNEQISEESKVTQEVLQLVSSDIVNNVIEDEDEEYDY
ncbi:hypothetical protein P9265_15015 [Schinkia azotoformans]|uniref:hypothetical protein n=1 Tax=Schinkia azotoformans TaxID=1454 RepID=UPI002E1D113A|nr:hypothetical protein [Schinkia azotoformans]